MSDWRLKLEEPEWALRERFIKVHSPLHNQEWCNALDLMLGMIADARDQAIAERDEARRALAEMWSAAWLLMWRAIGDSISADDWCNEWARCPSPEAFAEVTRERDALKAGKWAGAWEPFRPGFVRRERSGNVVTPVCAGSERAAIDAALVREGYYLEGGPHGAGEAK